MNFFLFIFLALLAFVTVGFLVVFYYIRKGIRFFRRFSTGDMSDEEFQRMANKYYRKSDDGSQSFSDDYFKGKGRSQNDTDGKHGQNAQQRQYSSRTTTGGVTIEDRRDPEKANKKIFAHDEGEYVDFTEN